MPNTFDVVLKFEQLINSRSAEAVCSLLTPDTVLMDSLGNRIQGAEKLRFAWTSYFNTVPDYSISHSEIFADGNMVAVFGTAQGTFSRDGQLAKENVWSTDLLRNKPHGLLITAIVVLHRALFLSLPK